MCETTCVFRGTHVLDTKTKDNIGVMIVQDVSLSIITYK